MRNAALFRALALAGLAAGCAGAPVPAPPPVIVAVDPPLLRIESCLPQNVDANGVTIALLGRIDNPNPIDLDLARFRYAVEVEGQRVAAGQVAHHAAIPAGGSLPVAIPARLPWGNVPGFLTMFLVRESLAVRVAGAADVRVPGGAIELPYAATGSVVLPRLPVVTLEGARVRESNLLDTVMEVRLRVLNPNPFPLPAGTVAFDLSVGGVAVAHAVSHSLAAVPAMSATPVLVPIRLSAMGAIAGILSAAAQGNPEVAFAGRLGYGALAVAVDASTALAPRQLAHALPW